MISLNNWFDPIEKQVRDRVRGFIQDAASPLWC
jgi:hypothetical protein